MNATDLFALVFLGLAAPVLLTLILAALPLGIWSRLTVALVMGGGFVQVALSRENEAEVLPLPGWILMGGLALLAFALLIGPRLRARVGRSSLPVLVGMHALRLGGAFFLLLQTEGRLGEPLASVAGWSEMAVAFGALGAAGLAARQGFNARIWVWRWNVLGALSALSLLFLMVTSAPGSPLQLFPDPPGSLILGDWPWRLIPDYFMPLLAAGHGLIFLRLRESPGPP